MKRIWIPVILFILVIAIYISLSGYLKSEDHKKIAMHDPGTDVKALYTKTWKNSAKVEYPTKFPGKVDHIDDIIGVDYTFGGYTKYAQSIRLKSDKDDRTSRRIEYSSIFYHDEGINNLFKCVDYHPKLVKKKEGIKYYYSLYKKTDAELGFKKNNRCHTSKEKTLKSRNYSL